MVGQTLAQKIVAKACGKDRVNAGEVEIANVDLAMIHDSGALGELNQFWNAWEWMFGRQKKLLL